MLNNECSVSLIERLHANGWSKYEIELLVSEAKTARENGKPLCRVFADVALLTGRKPNSVRNRYYAVAKDDPTLLSKPLNSIRHFSSEEHFELIKQMLIGITNGESVRGCALRLGNGDRSMMLRYQNKYRTTLQKQKELILEICGELRSEGIDVSDPYANSNEAKRQTARISETVKLVSALTKDELEQLISNLTEIQKAK